MKSKGWKEIITPRPLKRLIGILFIFCYFNSFLFAQQQGKVYGYIKDKEGPLEFVTVAIFNKTDSLKALFGTTTDSTGYFSISNILPGNYKIRLSRIGYTASSIELFVSEKEMEMNIGDHFLNKEAGLLETVTVVSQKKLIEKTPYGFIINAGANLTAAAGTATDILKNTPTITVDAEGGLTLRGKTPLILVNGRNSTLNNPNQIPASSIETIEIILDPSAKYDANAESGIINIKLKKNRQNGTNGAFAVGAGLGSRGRINSSILLNQKSKKWNLGVGYDNRFAGRTRKIDGSRTNYFLPDTYLLNQNRNDERVERLQNLKFTVDFTPDSLNAFSLELIGSKEEQDNDENLNSSIFRQNKEMISNINRHSIELERTKDAEGSFEYVRKFADERKSLTANISTSLERNRQNTDITSQSLDKNGGFIGYPYFQRTHNYESGNITIAQLDYEFPIGSKAHIETGYKGLFRGITADYETADKINNDYIVNTGASNIFTFREQVQGAYVLFNSGKGEKEIKTWEYEVGLRAEQVSNKGKTADALTRFTNRYFKLFPTANLVYHSNPDLFWKLSYGKRINRPDMDDLNPFIDITDSLNPHSGNPNLKPEIIHALSLGINREWEKTSLSSNIYYRYALNTIRQYAYLQPNGANLSYPENIGSAYTYGWENIFSAGVSRFFDFTASLSLFQQHLNGSNISDDAIQDAFSWNTKLINNLIPWKGGKIQLTGNYISALATPQGKRIAQHFIDMGFQQKLGKGNSRIGITVTDVFNTFKSGNINSTSTFTSYRYGKADTRAIIITFAYFFKSAFKETLLENIFSRDY